MMNWLDQKQQQKSEVPGRHKGSKFKKQQQEVRDIVEENEPSSEGEERNEQFFQQEDNPFDESSFQMDLFAKKIDPLNNNELSVDHSIREG